jgi:hypothetical protein
MAPKTETGFTRLAFLIHKAGKAKWYCRLSGQVGGLIKLLKNFTAKKPAKIEKAKRSNLLLKMKSIFILLFENIFRFREDKTTIKSIRQCNKIMVGKSKR